MYFLSSGQAMSKFLKNPRKYVLPPQPRPPCKLCITGPPCSGKSTIAHLLAQKYNSTVRIRNNKPLCAIVIYESSCIVLHTFLYDSILFINVLAGFMY